MRYVILPLGAGCPAHLSQGRAGRFGKRIARSHRGLEGRDALVQKRVGTSAIAAREGNFSLQRLKHGAPPALVRRQVLRVRPCLL
jgi:hypothetical protein